MLMSRLGLRERTLKGSTRAIIVSDQIIGEEGSPQSADRGLPIAECAYPKISTSPEAISPYHPNTTPRSLFDPGCK